MRFITGIVPAFLFVATCAADDGPVTIKLKQTGPGDVIRVEKSEKGANKATVTVMGMDQIKEEKANTKLVYTEEIIEKAAGAKKATKLKRVYQTADRDKDGEKDDLGLAGKTVLIEKKGDKYSITIDGTEVSGAAAEILNKDFSHEKHLADEDLMPTKPVKVGDTWKVDVEKLAKDMAANTMIVNTEKSTVTGKLIKVYEKAGAKFGVMEVTMDLTLSKIGGPGQEIELKDGSKLLVTATIDACIDGTKGSSVGKLTVKGDLTGTAGEIPIKLELTGDNNSSTDEVKKK